MRKTDTEGDSKEATLTQVRKTLADFIDETRHNFSAINSDREHDYNLWQKINQNVNSLEGKVENLTNSVSKLVSRSRDREEKLRGRVHELEKSRPELLPKKPRRWQKWVKDLIEKLPLLKPQ